jgi:hypothetical protein
MKVALAKIDGSDSMAAVPIPLGSIGRKSDMRYDLPDSLMCSVPVDLRFGEREKGFPPPRFVRFETFATLAPPFALSSAVRTESPAEVTAASGAPAGAFGWLALLERISKSLPHRFNASLPLAMSSLMTSRAASVGMHS